MGFERRKKLFFRLVVAKVFLLYIRSLSVNFLFVALRPFFVTLRPFFLSFCRPEAFLFVSLSRSPEGDSPKGQRRVSPEVLRPLSLPLRSFASLRMTPTRHPEAARPKGLLMSSRPRIELFP